MWIITKEDGSFVRDLGKGVLARHRDYSLRDECMRRVTLSVLAVPVLLLSGCLFEGSMDRAVYFENTTEQTLYIRRRDQLDQPEKYATTIAPNSTTKVNLVGRDECLDRWVITDKEAKVVKDPGMMCWHDTVTIP